MSYIKKNGATLSNLIRIKSDEVMNSMYFRQLSLYVERNLLRSQLSSFHEIHVKSSCTQNGHIINIWFLRTEHYLDKLNCFKMFERTF